MPNLEDFKPLVLRRKCPIKALLLDQTFSAGVGNWVAGQFSTFALRLTLVHLLR